MINRDMKNYKAQDDKAKLGEVIAMIVAVFGLLILLSWLTERNSYGMSKTMQIAAQSACNETVD